VASPRRSRPSSGWGREPKEENPDPAQRRFKFPALATFFSRLPYLQSKQKQNNAKERKVFYLYKHVLRR
jgi:hypothetical protein